MVKKKQGSYRQKMITLPQSTPFRERYVKVIAKIQTWCIVEDIITFDTETNQFEIPNGYQVDAEVVAWKYADSKRNTKEILDNYTQNGNYILRR